MCSQLFCQLCQAQGGTTGNEETFFSQSICVEIWQNGIPHPVLAAQLPTVLEAPQPPSVVEGYRYGYINMAMRLTPRDYRHRLPWGVK